MALTDNHPWKDLTALNADLITCRRCPRLTAWREQMAETKRKAYRDQVYWGKPVPGFGDPQARILILGLAPGAHGSNRTGRMFTGDASGDFLYPALYEAGFANQPASVERGDGLELMDVYISAICRCAPPDNKPTPVEIKACRPYLAAEMSFLPRMQGIVALGQLAFHEALRFFPSQDQISPKFHHGAFYLMGDNKPWLLASYHPSRQNTQTGRLTGAMFASIWKRARQELACD